LQGVFGAAREIAKQKRLENERYETKNQATMANRIQGRIFLQAQA
jgi:hypothetical protein